MKSLALCFDFFFPFLFMCFLGKGMAGWSWFLGWFWSDFVLCLVAVKSKGKEALNLGF